MKKLYSTLILMSLAFIVKGQTFDYSLSFLGINAATDNYQFALVATPSTSLNDSNTADMGAGFYLPSGTTIGNFVTGDSGIPVSDWSTFAIGSNASTDAVFVARVEAGENTILNGIGPFQLVLFDVVSDTNPTTGSISFMENGDPLLVANFVENYTNINLGDGTVNAYSQNDPDNKSSSFSRLAVDKFDLSDINISLYPNPTQGRFNIEANRNISYSIYNILGQNVIRSKDLNNNQIESISISHLPDGVYILKAQDENKNLKSFKIIKKE